MDVTTITLAAAPADCDVAALVRPVLVLATPDPAVVIWPCPRCWDEQGNIKMYSHVAGGVCFKCHGAGGEQMSRIAAQAQADKLIKGRITRARKAERERLAKLAAREALQAELIAAHPGLAELLDDAVVGAGVRFVETDEPCDGEDYNPATDRHQGFVVDKPLGEFVHSMATTFRYEPHRMTPKRCAAAVEAIAKERAKIAAHEAKVAAAGEVPTGRVVVTGAVVAVWERDVTFGYRRTTQVKMRVETPEGWVGIGTIPSGFWGTGGFDGDYRGLKGATVEFTATVEPAAEQRDGELPVGWLNRPTKAKVLALAPKLTVVK